MTGWIQTADGKWEAKFIEYRGPSNHKPLYWKAGGWTSMLEHARPFADEDRCRSQIRLIKLSLGRPEDDPMTGELRMLTIRRTLKEIKRVRLT